MKIMRVLQGAVLAAAIAGALAMTTVAAYAQETDQATQGQGPVTAPAAPPAIPDYAQPEAPGDGYMWTPGYWAWGSGGYYWVDGAWVEPPYVDALWTPGYWGFGFGDYMWYPGYWGLGIGYYGGINYGFGYFGRGFHGGYWVADASTGTAPTTTWAATTDTPITRHTAASTDVQAVDRASPAVESPIAVASATARTVAALASTVAPSAVAAHPPIAAEHAAT
jgi:hypothetical protein